MAVRDGRGLRVSPNLRVQRASLLVVLAVDSLVNGLFVPLSLLYLSEVTAAPLIVIGGLLTAANALTLPLPFLLGRFVDVLGPKRLTIAAQCVLAAGFVVYAVTANLWLAGLGAVLLSLGQRMFSSSIYTFVGDVADRDPRRRSRESGLAVIGSMRAIGYGLGALVAGVILTLGSAAATRLVIAGAVLVLLLCATTALLGTISPIRSRPSEPVREEGPPLRQNRPYLALIVLNCGFALCNVMLSLALPPFVKGSLPAVTWVVGPCLVLNTVLQASMQPVAVRLVSGLRRGTTLALAATCWAMWALLTASALAAPASVQPAVLLSAVAFYSAAQLMHSPISNAIAIDAAPGAQRGRYLAAFQNSFGIAQLIAPLLYASVSAASPGLFWLVIAGLALALLPATGLVIGRLPASATGAPQHA